MEDNHVHCHDAFGVKLIRNTMPGNPNCVKWIKYRMDEEIQS
jgi:hypothetical protein